MAKRGNNEGSISKRPDGRWMARISLPGGTRKYFYGSTRAEVAKKMAEATRDRDKGLPVLNERETLGRFLDRWLDESVRPTKRPKTIKSYEMQIRVHLKPTLGKVPLAKLSPQHVQNLQNDMLAAGLAPASVQYTRAVLRKALGQALKWGLVARNVVTLVDPPTVKKVQVRPLTPEQARTLLEHVRGDRYEALYIVALATGMRQGELLGLAWEDVDLEDKTVTVRRALQRARGKAEFVEPKTERSKRTIPVPEIVTQRLREYRAAQNRERLLAGDKWIDSGLVFTRHRHSARRVQRHQAVPADP